MPEAGPDAIEGAGSATGSIPSSTEPAEQAGLDRAAALAAGPGRFPRIVVAIAVGSFAVLGLGGAALDHFFPGPLSASTTATSAGDYPPPFPGTATRSASGARAASQLAASSAAMMGLDHLAPALAPNFSLADQHGHLLSLASLRGKVVLISFFDASCDDICTVLEAELAQAYVDLGSDASRVALVTVNTDPLALTTAAARPADEATRISSVPAWHFLSGSLPELDAIWKAYGISVEVQRSTGIIAHNNLMYFIDAAGHLRLRATPFADESASGDFRLPSATETSWASGIADQVHSLLGGQP